MHVSGDCYHVGIVVSDFDEGLRRYEALVGPFGPTLESPVTLDVGGGELQTVTSKIAFSKAGPVRIELLAEIPGSLWTTRPGVHHLGFWSDDVAAESAALVEAGYPVAARLMVLGPDQPAPVVYHHDNEGGFIELVAAWMEPAISSMWA